ncbi:unnamed protein product, partial [Closterium sp. Naga37s-1]
MSFTAPALVAPPPSSPLHRRRASPSPRVSPRCASPVAARPPSPRVPPRRASPLAAPPPSTRIPPRRASALVACLPLVAASRCLHIGLVIHLVPPSSRDPPSSLVPPRRASTVAALSPSPRVSPCRASPLVAPPPSPRVSPRRASPLVARFQSSRLPCRRASPLAAPPPCRASPLAAPHPLSGLPPRRAYSLAAPPPSSLVPHVNGRSLRDKARPLAAATDVLPSASLHPAPLCRVIDMTVIRGSVPPTIQRANPSTRRRCAACSRCCTYRPVTETALTNMDTNVSNRTLFVSGFSNETQKATLFSRFSEYGDVENITIDKDEVTGQSMGSGYITFSSTMAAFKALHDPNKTVNGRSTDFSLTAWSLPTASSATTGSIIDKSLHRIYVSHLPFEWNEEQLERHFSQYGKVGEHAIIVDLSTGKSKGYGFVTFQTKEGAASAVAAPSTTIA